MAKMIEGFNGSYVHYYFFPRLKRENQKRHIDTMVAERSKVCVVYDQCVAGN